MKARATFLLIVVFFLFAGAFLFLRSPYFDIDTVQISGNVRVRKDEIEALAGQEAENIFAYDLDKTRSLLESLPWVLEAKVGRRFPSAIWVVVTEREPVAFIPQGEDTYLMDEGGRILGKDDGTFDSLLGVTGIQGTLSAGRFLEMEKYGTCIKVVSLLPLHPGIKATEVCVQDGALALILDNGCTVLLGEREAEVERKLTFLDSILEDLSSDELIPKRIDLRFEKPAVTV